MSKRAEEKAINAWAVYEYREHPKGLYHTCFVDGYKEGYEQAEKDTVERIISYLEDCDLDMTVLDFDRDGYATIDFKSLERLIRKVMEEE